MPVVIPLAVMAVAATASAGMSAYQGVKATHAANEEKHNLAVEKDEMKKEVATMEQKAKAEADAKLSAKRSRSGRMGSIATSPLGVTDAAPISQASLAGKSMLG